MEVNNVPLTKITAPQHLEQAKVLRLAAAVQAGLVETCNVPPADLFQMVYRVAPECMILDPNFGYVHRSSEACVIEIALLGGRTDGQKRALYQRVVELASEAGFRTDDIMIALSENAAIDWSIGHGLAYVDVAAGGK